MKNRQGAIVLGIMCFLLTIGIIVQVSSIKNDQTVVAQEVTEDELRDEVLKLTDEYDRASKNLESKEEKLNSLRDKAAKNNESSEISVSELENNSMALGMTNVQGSGIEMTLESGDLLKIINALNNAGAEAISVNDKRVVFITTINNDGDIVYMDNEEVEFPCTIKAIGSDALYSATIMPGSYYDELKKENYDVSVIQNSNIFINKFDGVYTFSHAKEIKK